MLNDQNHPQQHPSGQIVTTNCKSAGTTSPTVWHFRETLKKIHTARFKAEQDPDGNNWKPLASSTLALKRKRGKSTKILRQDGYLADKTAYNVTSDNVEFGSQEVYARLHQFGGKAGRGKKVTVPARPWLGVGDKDEQLLLRKAEWHLGQIIGRMGK